MSADPPNFPSGIAAEVIRQSADAISVTRLKDGIVLYVNDAFAASTGFGPEHIVGRSTLDVGIWVDAADRARMAADLASGGVVRDRAFRFRRRDGEVRAGAFSARVFEMDGERYILHSARDLTEEQRSGRAAIEADATLRAINETAFELASLPPDSDVMRYLARRLRQVTGAAVVGLSEYDRAARELVTRHIETDSRVLAIIRRVGFRLEGLRSPVSPEIHEEMTRSLVGHPRTLAEATFGAMPSVVSSALQAAAGIERLTALAFIHEGELYGTALLAFRRGTAAPPPDLLLSFAALGAVILRRRQAEDALRESIERYQSIFRSRVVGVYVHDFDGRFVDANDVLLQLLGYARGDISSVSLVDVLGPEQVAVARAEIAALLATGETRPYLYAARAKDGRTVWLETEAAILYRSGVPAAVHGTARDMTARIEAEEALRESEARFRGIVERIPDGIFIVGEQGRIIEANDAACSQLDYSRDELVGLPLEEIVAPSHRDRVRGRLRDVDAPAIPFESVHLRRDGTEFPVEVTAMRMAFAGQPAVLGVARDISERKHVEAERARLQEQLIEIGKLESIGLLAGGVAHDFNNMLAPILGYAQMFRGQFPRDDPRHDDAEEIILAAERARDLVRQLLAFARRAPLETQTLDLNEVVRGMERMLRRTLRENVAIGLRLDPAAVPIRGDSGQLSQVILNLAVNAQDAMPDGGTLTIATCRAEPGPEFRAAHPDAAPGPHVLLSVSDTGAGMDRATLARVFEPFFTTKEAGRGTGLGLSTVYGIIRQHGGAIWGESEPGAGTTFRAYLPIDVGADTSAIAGSPASSVGGTETILVVEDQPQVRRYVLRVLEQYGYRVLSAANGPEALEIAAGFDHPIDLLLSDVVMPFMNGAELGERLGAIRPGLRTLFMSGYPDPVINQHGVLDGDVDFVQKPVAPSELLARVREVLDRP